MLEALSLFIGALLDATIGPNLIVPGEPFLLAAGVQAFNGVYLGIAAVLLGGWLGDQISYWLGVQYGFQGQLCLVQWKPKLRRSIARCRLLMRKHGDWVLLFARLLGPVSWVVPFMAGSVKVPWRRFTLFSSLGLILGVGQFVAWGFLLAAGMDAWFPIQQVKAMLLEHMTLMLSILLSVGLLIVAMKRQWRCKWLLFILALSVSLVATNYRHFFFLADNDVTAYELNDQAVTIEELSYKAFPGRSGVYDAQAINVMYVGESPRVLMENLGWLENHTFSRNEVELMDYVGLLQKQLLPVSDLFLDGVPQAMAFQQPGDLLTRSHIRWWKVGVEAVSEQGLWLGAISYDNGLKLAHYSGIVTVLHSIDPNVDSERDGLAEQIEFSDLSYAADFYSLAHPVAMDENHDYFSDGNVLVIADDLATKHSIFF